MPLDAARSRRRPQGSGVVTLESIRKLRYGHGRTEDPPYCRFAAEGRVFRAGNYVRVALPCCGIDGGTRGLRHGGATTHVVAAWDTDASLFPALCHLHGREAMENFHLGKIAGDILRLTKQDIVALGPVDMLLAGPPCPPWYH